MERNLELAFFPFSGPRLPTNNRAPQLPTDQWAKNRQLIEDLYIHQHKTLHEVVSTMKREHNFYATYDVFRPYGDSLAD
jgi:hypothetical protein